MANLFREAGILYGSGSFADKTTTVDTWVDVGVIPVMAMKTKKLVFKGATNTVEVQVLGSLDSGLTYQATPVIAAFDVAAAATVVKDETALWTDLKVQTRPKVAATHGKLSTNWLMVSW